MKIFISHSSKNANYGEAMVELLTAIGIKDEEIIFTSNDAYGIPIGQNIFQWLKERINEKPYVLYLLSAEYYKSVACLNEMGAAWVTESKHAMLFTPDFKLDSYEFQSGAIDPREIGFFINNGDKILAFIESLRADFSISSNQVLISQRIKAFLEKVNLKTDKAKESPIRESIRVQNAEKNNIETATHNKGDERKTHSGHAGTDKFLSDLLNNKLRDEEVILLHYITENARYKLFTGWQEHLEVEKIEMWQDINDLNRKLSGNYQTLLRRLEMKGIIEVSQLTSSGNPKEYKVVDKMAEQLLDLQDEYKTCILQVLGSNTNSASELPF